MSKRLRADVDGMTSAGLTTFGKDSTYVTTNVSNLSLYDSSYKHGIQAAFNQDRTQQIIPNTSRSEVGIAYAEIQTKSLPIFQPQVKIGTDPDTLIYEVGLTVSWSGSLIDPITKGSRISTLLDSDSATDIYTNGTGAPTLQIPELTDGLSANITVKDAYKNSFDLELYAPHETLLSYVFGLWRDSSNPLFMNSPLIPVVVGSVYQPMKVMAPLLDATPSVIGAYIAVESVEGFKVGDRVRVFGSVNSAAVGTALNKYTTILGICLYSDLVVSGGATSPTSNNPTIITSPVLVVDNTSSTGLNITSTSALYRGGYVINCEADERGGSVQFLTDEFEFKPLTVTPTASASNLLTVNLPAGVGVTANKGFLRTNGVDYYKGVVEIRSVNDPKISGYYKVASVTSTTSMTLTPLTLSLDVAAVFVGTATLSLAPNAYTFDTSVSKSTPTSSTELRMIAFARYLGLQPTHSFEPLQAMYPPIATVLTQSWRRAYSVDFVISAYRNLKWVTQDIAPKPSNPEVQQDFGDGSTSTYYNVYDMKRFLSECVNPAFQNCLNDQDVSSNYIPNFSIQKQLDFYVTAYQRAFTQPNIDLAYSPSITYFLGDSVIYEGGIYMALKLNTGALPNQPAFWVYLGPKKIQSGEDLLPFNALAWEAVTGGQAFTMVGASMNAERVQLSNSPKVRTKAPQFHYDTWANLFSMHLDSYSFGDTYPYGYITLQDGTFVKNDLNFNYKSWGVKNAGDGGGEEYFNIESDSSFKFLFDNFSCEAIPYINPATNDILVYWVYSAYDNEHWTDSLKLSLYRIFTQSAESTSACVSPVQTIVVISRTIPVVQSLASPAAYVSDFNARIVNLSGVTGDSDSIIGEFSITPGMLNSSKSVIRYQPDEVTYYSLQSTKVFKQLDYFVCYRHRITQKLVPLILSNYGNVNIKFVFKPT